MQKANLDKLKAFWEITLWSYETQPVLFDHTNRRCAWQKQRTLNSMTSGIKHILLWVCIHTMTPIQVEGLAIFPKHQQIFQKKLCHKVKAEQSLEFPAGQWLHCTD